MRIKTYDYKTCLKLKNPLGNFEEVSKFVKDMFVITETSTFANLEVYELKGVYAFISNDLIEFFVSNDFPALEFYSLKLHDQPYISNKKQFEELKSMFLTYKQHEYLMQTIVSNNTTKRVINKI